MSSSISKVRLKDALWMLVVVWLSILSNGGDAAVTSPDEARRFGVAESLLAKSSKSWKVECSETSTDFFERFRDLDEIYAFMKDDLVKRFDGQVKSIGTTAEKRQILSLRIGPASARRVVLAMAGLHGREWTSVAALLFAIANLAKEDFEGGDLALVVIPVTNPDGYVKTFDGGTHTKERYKQGVGVETEPDQPNRYWRKNGVGVDLNRNFGYAWGNDTKKSNKLEQSDVYQGTGPFSERETKALNNWAEANIDHLAAIIDFHCCIGAVLAPPLPPGTSGFSAEENERVGRRIVEALSEGGKGVTRSVKGGDGVPGAYEWRTRSKKDIGAALSSSWGFVELVVDLTFVVEMRGKFVAPCWEIRQLGKEALLAMRTLVKEVKARPPRPLKERKQLRLASSSTSSLRGSASPYGDLGKSFIVVMGMCLAVLVYLTKMRGGLPSWLTGGTSKRSNGKE